jgi:threonine dehydrogenase-like Zn-dependent dehydrogenase
MLIIGRVKVGQVRLRGLGRGPAPTFGQPGRPLHEIVGRVRATADRRYAVGDRVVGWASRFDGLQEQIVTEADAVAHVPADLTDAQAIAPQALAVVLALADRVPTFVGKRVAVIGLGTYGNLLAAVAKARGADEVVGIDPVDRTAEAAAFGVDRFVHATSRYWAQHLSDDERPDIVIEAVGHQVATFADALEAVAPRGGIYLFGAADEPWLSLPLGLIWIKELTVTGGPANDRHGYLEKGKAFLAEHPDLPDKLVSRIVPYTATQAAFEDVDRPRPGLLKVVISGDPVGAVATA